MRPRALLPALLLAGCAAMPPGTVGIPAPGLMLQAQYVQPTAPTAPAVIALHGCGGPFPARDTPWRELLVQAGHPVVSPNSFASRGLGSQCKTPSPAVSPSRERRADAVAAAEWLAVQPGTPPGGAVVLGWSNGGSTTLAAAGEGVMPPGLVRGYVALYPGCRGVLERGTWSPAAPILIVMGEDDDWTPAAPCRALAARFPGQITLVLYPGAYHDFDQPNRPVVIRTGLAFTANGDGTAHDGTNEAARAAAFELVPRWIAALPPAHVN